MSKKESRQFTMSVEGINCEKMYFDHLAKLINNSERSTYNLKIAPKVMSPLEYAKRNSYKPVDKRKGNQRLPYIHIQDIEDYYSEYHKKKFCGLIDEIRKVESKFGITYELGYSNYTFELWMLLHVADMNYAVTDRYAYLAPINRWFKRNFKNLKEFKSAEEFPKILDEFVTLDTVFAAISRAEKIVCSNAEDGKVKETYNGFSFYRDNPDISVHEVVRMILEVCEVK